MKNTFFHTQADRIFRFSDSLFCAHFVALIPAAHFIIATFVVSIRPDNGKSEIQNKIRPTAERTELSSHFERDKWRINKNKMCPIDALAPARAIISEFMANQETTQQ